MERFSNQDLKDLIGPLFFEQFLVMLVGLVDTFMISYAGEAAVSGVSLVNLFNIIFIYIFTALASGGSVVVSQYIGSKNMKKAIQSASQLLMISVLVSLVILVFVLVCKKGMLGILFGQVEPKVMDACLTYLRISAYSYPALAIYNAGAALYRSMGKTSVTMYISMISNGINIVGNAIGIFVLHAGVAGVAYPSLIARAFSAITITVLCFRKKKSVSYEWKYVFTWIPDLLKRMMKVAIPNGIENGLFQIAKVALTSITALFGTYQIAANGVAQSFWSLSALVGVAIGPAFITVIGQCMGAGDIEAADYYFKKLFRITLIVSITWNTIIFAVTPLALHFYALSPKTKHLVLILVLIHNVFNATIFPISNPFSNGLRAAGDVKFTMIVSIFSTVICRVILSIFFAIILDLGVIGIAIAMVMDWGIRASIFYARYRSGKWKKFKVI